jgi:hypothetical protein
MDTHPAMRVVRFTAILILIAATCAVSIGPVAIGLGQHNGEITIVDPRPLAAAAREVEATCQCAVTYEDPAWARNQVTPSTVARRRPDGTRTLVPKGMPLRLALPERLDLQSRSAILADLQSMMTAFWSRPHLGEFRVMDDGRMFHIRPDGSSALDVPLTISETITPLGEAIDLLTRSIKASSGQSVVVGMAPVNLIRQSTTHLVASGESARDVLGRILDATGQPLSWQLMYDFESAQFFLSIYPLS